MANSEFEYVKDFEQWDALTRDHWIVVRVDGKGFSKFSKKYGFEKPNDRRAIELMNAAAVEVVRQFVDVVVAYGQSDEYSFIFHEETNLFERRAFKLATTIATTFSVEYAMQWPTFFSDVSLSRPYPTFDGRCVLYPKLRNLRDYLRWRQADCHINNLYNTTFWALVQRGGLDGTAAEQLLKGTLAKDKNEILFSRFGINYNDEAEVWKKGSVAYRDYPDLRPPAATVNADDNTSPQPDDSTSPQPDDSSSSNGPTSSQTQTQSRTQQSDQKERAQTKKPTSPPSRTQTEKERKRKQKASVVVEHVDIIRDEFWDARPWILAGSRKQRRSVE